MNYLIVVLLIGVLIFVHELGHFVAAKVSGVPIARFSIGFGPVILSRRIKGTEYCLSLFPLGGYVLPDGIDCVADLYEIPLKKRIFYILGGPFGNITFALICIMSLNLISGNISFYSIVVDPISQTLLYLYKIVCSIGLILKNPDQISGIVGIVAQGGQFVGRDIIRFINFSIFLSINLAVFNLLPLPPLDGGVLLIYLFEKINHRLLKLHIPLAVTGWVLLFGLILYATVLDIGRISAGFNA
jgi:regulator of sigma E protease